MRQRLLTIGWPAFLVAGVLEMVVFALVDPEALHGLLGEEISLSRAAIYSLTFFLFWAASAAAAAISLWLAEQPSAHNHHQAAH
jgi:hypothetical protein